MAEWIGTHVIWFGVVLCGIGLLATLAAIARHRALSPLFLILEVAGIAVLVLSAYLSAAAVRRERLERLNAEAVADSTHHFLRGQLQIATRLIVQKPLPEHATATVTIRVPGKTVTKTDTLLVGDTLRAHLDTNGVHVSAVVMLLPRPALWDWTLRQDSLSYRVTFERCRNHAAQVSVAGPRWQAVQLTELQQDPNVCNPKPSWSPFSLKPPSALWMVVIAGATYILTK